MLGVHALAQGIVHFGKIARKQHLYDLCLETLNKIHKKQSVPVIDCFLKVIIINLPKLTLNHDFNHLLI